MNGIFERQVQICLKVGAASGAGAARTGRAATEQIPEASEQVTEILDPDVLATERSAGRAEAAEAATGVSAGSMIFPMIDAIFYSWNEWISK